MPKKTLPYTNDEIVQMYRDAKDKKKEIRILAELNCCVPQTIRRILNSEGIKLSNRKEEEKENDDKKKPGLELPAFITKEIIGTRLSGIEEEIRYHKQLIDNSLKVIAEREVLYKQLSEIMTRGSV